MVDRSERAETGRDRIARAHLQDKESEALAGAQKRQPFEAESKQGALQQKIKTRYTNPACGACDGKAGEWQAKNGKGGWRAGHGTHRGGTGVGRQGAGQAAGVSAEGSDP